MAIGVKLGEDSATVMSDMKIRATYSSVSHMLIPDGTQSHMYLFHLMMPMMLGLLGFIT